jgi:hypothetical protein
VRKKSKFSESVSEKPTIRRLTYAGGEAYEKVMTLAQSVLASMDCNLADATGRAMSRGMWQKENL